MALCVEPTSCSPLQIRKSAYTLLGIRAFDLADGDRLAMSRLVGEAWRARLAPDNVAELCEGWYRDALAR